MKTTYITVVGDLPVRFDLEQSMKIGPVVASGNTNKHMRYSHITANTEAQAQDLLNSPAVTGSNIVLPQRLFRKYCFFDTVTNLPELPGLRAMDVDPERCTAQSLSLLLSVYLVQTVVFLVGYDISDPRELSLLRRVAEYNGQTKFTYICNPPRTHQLDDLDNCYCDTFDKYQEVIARAG
jgi:hypothetical protein